MDELTAWRDDNFASIGELDTGDAYARLLQSVGLAAGFLVEISFSLKQEKRYFLDKPRNFIELCAELYQSVSNETLDFFIDSNNLTGSEIIELPLGREIVYYV